LIKLLCNFLQAELYDNVFEESLESLSGFELDPVAKVSKLMYRVPAGVSPDVVCLPVLPFAGQVSIARSGQSLCILQVSVMQDADCEDGFDPHAQPYASFGIYINGEKINSLTSGTTDGCPVPAWCATLVKTDAAANTDLLYQVTEVDFPERLSSLLGRPLTVDAKIAAAIEDESFSFDSVKLSYLSPALQVKSSIDLQIAVDAPLEITRVAFEGEFFKKSKVAKAASPVPLEFGDLLGAVAIANMESRKRSAQCTDPVGSPSSETKAASKL
jgi:hypothetical protein